MMDEYEAFRVKLDSAIKTTLEGPVEDALWGGIAASVVERVYDAYTPTKYKRRYTHDGGLLDTDSYDFKTEQHGNEHTLTVTNMTKGNPNYSLSDGWDAGYITDIIESGKGYHWKKSEIYQTQQPRPFMEEVFDEVPDLEYN